MRRRISIKSTTSKRKTLRNKRKRNLSLRYLDITLKEDNGTIGNYKINTKQIPLRSTSMSTKKHSILHTYKASDEVWVVANPEILIKATHYSKLKNEKIVITNGKKTIKGEVLEVACVGGGSTNPPSIGGLPPIDEN